MVFENRSFDNLLGRLYAPEDGKTFERVVGKNLSNPIPDWAEYGADRKVVPYTIATDMDAPNPHSGEEYFHTNSQVFNILDDHTRSRSVMPCRRHGTILQRARCRRWMGS